MADTTVPDTVEREMILRAPVERVWSALTDPAEIVKWFGDGVEIDLRPGGAAVFHFGDERCPAIVHAVEENRRFAFYWMPGPNNGDPVTEARRTLVEFTLEPHPDGTRLRLVESGFASIVDPSVRTANSEGWDEELGELTSYLNAA